MTAVAHDFTGATAAVTGASAGLGTEFARQLAPRVRKLILIARRRERLEALAAELGALYPSLSIRIEAADLSKADEIDALIGRLHDEEIDLLINNAGLGDIGLFENSAWPRNEEMLRVNIDALTHLTHAVLPLMIARGRGAVLNVASVAGYLPLPTFAVYAATKAYVNSFSEALYWELRGTGVTVTALCLGPVPTEFGAVANRKKEPSADGEKARAIDSPRFVQIEAKQAVAEALAGIIGDKPRVVPGFFMRWSARMMSRFPLTGLRLLFSQTIPKAARKQRGVGAAAQKRPVSITNTLTENRP